MKPIWYFVGILLLAIGILVLGAGIVGLMTGEVSHTVLGDLHPRIWWGAIMTVAGLLFYLFNRKSIA
jgi:hypothetical protein